MARGKVKNSGVKGGNRSGGRTRSKDKSDDKKVGKVQDAESSYGHLSNQVNKRGEVKKTSNMLEESTNKKRKSGKNSANSTPAKKIAKKENHTAVCFDEDGAMVELEVQGQATKFNSEVEDDEESCSDQDDEASSSDGEIPEDDGPDSSNNNDAVMVGDEESDSMRDDGERSIRVGYDTNRSAGV